MLVIYTTVCIIDPYINFLSEFHTWTATTYRKGVKNIKTE